MSLFNHIPINFQQAQLIEKDNAHYYQTPKGDVFPSITTILQKTMCAGSNPPSVFTIFRFAAYLNLVQEP